MNGNGGGLGREFYGKYRGIVSDNQDPLMLGRVRARIPDVTGDDECGWATPCAPFGGSQTGFFAIPASGAGVWIEFEHGDPDYPIWSGCWWGTQADLPPLLLTPPYQKVIIQTAGGQSITLDDTPGAGGITLATSGGAKITISDIGIEIDNGQGGTIMLTATQVSVNDGALQVV
jgi:uncharacterized protein involved in type VI secretion and phage assembly